MSTASLSGKHCLIGMPCVDLALIRAAIIASGAAATNQTVPDSRVVFCLTYDLRVVGQFQFLHTQSFHRGEELLFGQCIRALLGLLFDPPHILLCQRHPVQHAPRRSILRQANIVCLLSSL